MKMRSKMQNEKGFTLVELMVVVVILGILVAIAVPIYNNVTTKAKQNSCDATIRTLNGASSMYLAENENGEFPESISDLVPKYIQETPKCPFTNTDTYTMDKDTGVWSCSHDKVDNDDD